MTEIEEKRQGHDRFDPLKVTKLMRRLRDEGVDPASLFCDEPDEQFFLTDPDAIPSQLLSRAMDELEFIQEPPTGMPEEWEHDPVLRNLVLIGDDFRRPLPGLEDEKQTRRVITTRERDTGTNEIRYVGFTSDGVGRELADSLQEDLYQHAQRQRHNPDYPPEEIQRQLDKTQRKKFSSATHPFNEDAAVRARGGDPHTLIVKPRDSFKLSI